MWRCQQQVLYFLKSFTTIYGRVIAPVDNVNYNLYGTYFLYSFQIIVTEMLGRYNKRLDDEQLENLLTKESSSNPLWLSIAIEELRVFGMFRKILDKINQLADGLLEWVLFMSYYTYVSQ